MDFDWDDGNRAKAQKHGLTLSEIEHAMRTGARVAPDPVHSLREQRFIAIGRTPAGRHVFVAFCFRGARVRPISARYMHAREIARHEAAQGSGDDDG
jgi:uncharacterized DUF497 family protein